MQNYNLKMALASSIFFLVLLAGCSSGKWDASNPDMPQGLIELHQQKIAEAEAQLLGNPEDTAAIFELGFRYDQLGDLKKARSYYQDVLAISPNDFATLNNLASLYEKVEDYNKATKYIMELYELNSTNTEVIRDSVRILIKAKDFDKAEEIVENYARVFTSEEAMALVDELQHAIDKAKNK